jgi:predicted dehydrogenase
VLDQGYHLFVEKPIGRNSREARPLLDAALRSRARTQVGFNQRHAETMRQGKQLVDEPDFGGPTYIESRHWQSGRLHPTWGIDDVQYAWLMLHGIHAVDMLRYVFGEVVEVSARKSRRDDAGSLVGLCHFANGANGVLNLHSSTGTGDQFFEAVGTGRAVRVTGFQELSYHSADRWAPGISARQGQFIRYGHGVMRGDSMGYRTELQDFARALLAGEAPFPSIPDGYESTRLAEAFYASACTGQPVKVAEAPVIDV